MRGSTPRPEWLRPVGERLLGGDAGPPPGTVRAATVLAAVNAVAAAAMVTIWAPMIVSLVREQPAGFGSSLLIAVPLAVTGAVLAVVLAAAVVMLGRRGWLRLPLAAASILAVLALIGVFVAAVTSRVPAQPTPELSEDLAATAVAVLPWLVAVAVAALSLVALLRTSSAGTWLARRRYRHRQGRPVVPASRMSGTDPAGGPDPDEAYLRQR